MTAAPIDEQVTRIRSAPAASAEPTWPTTLRDTPGVNFPCAITSLIRLSSTILKVFTPGSRSLHKRLNTGARVTEVWIKPSF